MAFDNIHLEKGMYHEAGRSFTQVLEQLDPSEGYRGTPLENTDAFQRQLKRFGIRGTGDGGCGFGPELFQHLFHFVSDFPFRSCGTHKKTAPRPIQDERPLFRGTTRYSARDAPHSSL